jgi:hypothetical protein
LTDSFLIDLLSIQPSQLFINKKKLSKILAEEKEQKRIIPIKKLNDRIIFTDGHTRALVAYLQGKKQILVEWDDTELDWEAYQICVEWCCLEKIESIADLKDRQIEDDNYQILWLKRCKVMQEELKKLRAETK